MRHVCCKENLKKNHKKMLTKLQNTSMEHNQVCILCIMQNLKILLLIVTKFPNPKTIPLLQLHSQYNFPLKMQNFQQLNTFKFQFSS